MRYPEVEVKKIITDFRNCQKDGFFEIIDSELKRLDVSMLVNNVGILFPNSFMENSDKEVYDMVNVNLMTSIMLTKKLLPRMLLRGHKNGIITISDNEGISRNPLFTNAYGTTKAALIYFMNSLNQEFGNKIDFLTLTPIRISGGKDFNNSIAFTAIGPDCYVNSSLKSLGRVNLSFGSWKQAFLAPYINNFTMFRNLDLPTLQGMKEKLRLNNLPTWRGMKQQMSNSMPTWTGMKQKVNNSIPSWRGMKQQVRNAMPTWRGIKQKLGMGIKTE